MKNLELASPSEMSASARAGEIAAILAAAIVRTFVADEPKQRAVDRDHHVRVTADGTFEYEGQQFKSLSAVARHIAGTPWSGPLFFGLRRAGEGYE